MDITLNSSFFFFFFSAFKYIICIAYEDIQKSDDSMGNSLTSAFRRVLKEKNILNNFQTETFYRQLKNILKTHI